MSDVEVAEKALKRKKKKHVIKARDLLSSGSTLLNLAATGRIVGCYAKGLYYWLVGDSDSGKTWYTLSMLAEAAINPEFDDYRFIHDNSEGGALMDIERFFGKAVADRIEPPKGTKEEPIYSETVEDMYFNIHDAIKEGKPFIWIEDSIDALEAKEDAKKFEKIRKRREGKGQPQDDKGTYGTAKAKLNSMYLRKVISGIRKTGSIVVFVSQSRDMIGGFGFGQKTAAGGRALKFYATLQIWTSIKEKIQKRIKKKLRQLGILGKVQIKKNRITGRDRKVFVPIYHSYGIDDIGSCIDYLIEEGHWTGSENNVRAPEFEHNGSKEELIAQIQREGLEENLKHLVGAVWAEIEAACELQRKARY